MPHCIGLKSTDNLVDIGNLVQMKKGLSPVAPFTNMV